MSSNSTFLLDSPPFDVFIGLFGLGDMNHVPKANFLGNPQISLNSIKILPAQSQITHTLRLVTPPSRSVMAESGNKPLSEFMLLALEPVAKRMKGMEINASSGLLNIIESITTDISSRQ